MRHEQIALPRPSEHFWRAAAAAVRAYVESVAPADMVKRMYPDDKVAPIILRAASTAATTSDAAWAGPLAQLSISEAIEDIVAMTVAGRLARAGALQVDIGRYASVRVPGRATHAADAGQWVQEGHPIPARQLQILAGPTLTPQKLACITTMTREMSEASNIEAVVRQFLTEAAGMAIDAALFSASAATAAQPAGLLHGLTSLTPSASTGFDAVGKDLGALVGDIATRGGGARAFFVASPAQAVAVRFYAGGQFYVAGSDALPIAASVGLPAGTVVAIEPESLCFSIAPPEFSVANQTAIHQEDTTPLDIVAGGTASTPIKSMFQIDGMALRMNLWASWGMRAPHVAFMSSVLW